MNIKGKIIEVRPETSGVSKSGKTWRKQEVVLETDERYSKKLCFDVFNDNIDSFALQPGQTLSVDFDIESHEWNGKWYHSVTAWRINQ